MAVRHPHLRALEGFDAAGGAPISRAPPALPQQAVAGLSTARAGQLQASAGIAGVGWSRAGASPISQFSVQLVFQGCRAGSLARSFLHTGLGTGARDAPRALSFPRKKSLTRTTY